MSENSAPKQQHRHELHGHSGYDPLLKAERETLTFNRLWFRNGEKQSLVQKIGFMIFSLLFVGFGLFFLKACAIMWSEGDIFFLLFFGALAAFFLLSGLFGLRNVMRFAREG